MSRRALLPLLFLAAALGGREREAPRGLTMTVDAQGVWRLLWEPIYAGDLMGYSVWKRAEGEGEDYVRVLLPVKIGQRTERLPITTQARYAYKEAGRSRDWEFVVVAEYESGRSAPSPPVRSRLARRLEPPSAPAAASPTSQAPAESEVEAAVPPPAGEGPSLRPRRPLRVLPGRVRTWFRMEYVYEENQRRGFNSADELGVVYLNGSMAQRDVVAWELKGGRHALRVPLGLALGLFPGLEAGGEIWLASEYPSRLTLKVKDQLFEQIHPFVERFDDFGLADSVLRVRLAPLPEGALTLGASYWLPTGRSRVRAWLEAGPSSRSRAGNAAGVARLELEAAWGDKWSRPGMHYFAAYAPAATESFVLEDGGVRLPYQVVHGERVELGGGYSFPYALLGEQGTIVLGAVGRAVAAGRYHQGGRDLVPGLSEIQRVEFENVTAVSLRSQEQLELFGEVEQYLRRGISSRGRFWYLLKPNGYAAGLSGGFVY